MQRILDPILILFLISILKPPPFGGLPQKEEKQKKKKKERKKERKGKKNTANTTKSKKLFPRFPKRLRALQAAVVQREQCGLPPRSPTVGTGGPSPAARPRRPSDALPLPDFIFSLPTPGWLTPALAPRAGGDIILQETPPGHSRGAARTANRPRPPEPFRGSAGCPGPAGRTGGSVGPGPPDGSVRGAPRGRDPRRAPPNPAAPTSCGGNFFLRKAFFKIYFFKLPSLTHGVDILPRLP